MNADAIFFHNNVPSTYRLIEEDLIRHDIPAWAREHYLSSLVAFAPEKDDAGWETHVTARTNRAVERKMVSPGHYQYRDPQTKKPVDEYGKDSASGGVKKEEGVESPAGTSKTPPATEGDAMLQKRVQGQLKELASSMAQQYGEKGDRAAYAIAQAGGKFGLGAAVKDWAKDKINTAFDEATDWVRAFAGDTKKQIGSESIGTHYEAAKAVVATGVRVITNPLVELIRLGVNASNHKSEHWGFADHDVGKLEQKWGKRTANLVLASGTALAGAVSLTGLVAGVALATNPAAIGVAGAAVGIKLGLAGAGMGALLNYCPGFRAWVSRAPAKIALHCLNKVGLYDTVSEREQARVAKKVKAKEDFEKKSREAGFADDDKVPSPEKIVQIAKEFWTGIYKKWWAALMKDKKVVKALAKLGEMHAKDPALVKKVMSQMNAGAKLSKLAKMSDTPRRVYLEGVAMSRKAARRSLQERLGGGNVNHVLSLLQPAP